MKLYVNESSTSTMLILENEEGQLIGHVVPQYARQLVRKNNLHERLVAQLKELVSPGMKTRALTMEEWQGLSHIKNSMELIAEAEKP